MTPSSGKSLLAVSNERRFNGFLCDDEPVLILPQVSASPFHAASSAATCYTKIDFSPHGPHRLRCIKKDNKTHSWVWLTQGKQIKTAVRWGIIQPASLTGKLIATLGQYRHITHQRVVKGMMTKTQDLKVRLVDLYQDRIQLLSAFESMVNCDNGVADFQGAFDNYTKAIDQLKAKLRDQDHQQLEDILPGTVNLIEAELSRAQKRALDYFNDLKHCTTLNPTNRARGHSSILEYVKQESLQLLYELQGLNQDFSFSRNRHFALTRGELNDAIEDARKVIDSHRADPKNKVTAQHHVDYPDDYPVAFHFNPEEYSPDQERQALMAVSFIEGWDKFSPHTCTVKNEKEEVETLDVMTATKWQPYRSLKAFLKGLGYFIWHVIKGFVSPTLPWDEEAWKNKDFHLFQHQLHPHTRPNTHIWWKIFHFIKKVGQAMYDLVDGIRDFASHLVLRLPQTLVDDWASTHEKPSLAQMYATANAEIQSLLAAEAAILKDIQASWEKRQAQPLPPQSTANVATHLHLAKPAYSLSAGEQNDILTAMVRGLDGFATFFTHNIYSKDPVGGLLFTLAYAWGGAALYLPEVSKFLFGQDYVNWFQSFAKTMGATELAGTIAGGSTQGQLFSSAWDLLMHGPSSGLVETSKEILKDPITIAAGFWLAYGVGYLLAHGINGHDIPVISEYFREEMGTVPSTTYPITGAKLLITLYEILHTPHHPLLENIKKELDSLKSTHPQLHQEIERMQLLCWLHEHAESLPKLDHLTQFQISQQIEAHFKSEDARSLKTMLYPEKPRSIAFQLFYIPLSYLPALLRLVTAFCMSMVAWYQEKPHPWHPIQRAASALSHKLAYDLNRLFIFIHELLRLVFKCAACVFKALAFTLNLAIGRIGGLFKTHPGHYIHRGFAAIHRGLAWVREWLYPARATESVLTRHPRCTLKKLEASHHQLMTILRGQNETRPTESNDSVYQLWRDVETQTPGTLPTNTI